MSDSPSTTERRRARLLAWSHATVDFCQGAIAALVPFFVLDRGYDYAHAAAVVLASSLASSIVQPLFGALGDKWRMPWLIPTSIFVSGAGLAAIAISGAFPITILAAAVSGIGVAAFHPAGASQARLISGDDHVVMSWFSLGGNLGFAFSTLIVAASVGVLGLRATPLLLIPGLTGVVAVMLVVRTRSDPGIDHPQQATSTTHKDDWTAFARTSIAITCRSIVFVTTGSFIGLLMHRYHGVNQHMASTALFIFYLGGAVGTTIGGRLARHWSRITILQWSYFIAIPVMAGMILTPGPLAFVFIPVASIALYVPFSLHVSLGQELLPHHMGTASGVTLGLAVSIGGIASPAIGALGDHIGLQPALTPLILLPAIAGPVLWGMKDPR
ncbi:MAG: MFS transporter [Acidipropionibacterium sp.]|jgi:FSR family fosmidomycin resistance protein-like MFS transporter|nr:MFS transporter [Acidipropionibacterium sp.]